ncbi:hypothetical protein [Alkalicoccus luteus]|uniref:hypothetical protein n=1 Tax=Alkalicoccus luteus TaxID=1237094 RepID=UPI0040348EA9
MSTDRTAPEMVYEGVMVLLAFAAVSTIWFETRYEDPIVWGTWGVFFVDFCVRFYRAEQKLSFFKDNPFIVIAIIPLDAVFQAARLARILHFLRLKAMTKYYAKPAIKVLSKQKLMHVLPGVILFVFLCTIPLYWAEQEKLAHYAEAWGGAAASLIFFGYAYIDPDSITGNIVIALLTFSGVILHACILRWVFDTVKETKAAKAAEEKGKDLFS